MQKTYSSRLMFSKILTCWKQNGIASTPTPIILLAKVMDCPVAPIFRDNSSNYLSFMPFQNTETEKQPHHTIVLTFI